MTPLTLLFSQTLNGAPARLLSLADFYFGLTLGINSNYTWLVQWNLSYMEELSGSWGFSIYPYIRNIHSYHPRRNHMRSLANEIMA